MWTAMGMGQRAIALKARMGVRARILRGMIRVRVRVGRILRMRMIVIFKGSYQVIVLYWWTFYEQIDRI